MVRRTWSYLVLGAVMLTLPGGAVAQAPVLKWRNDAGNTGWYSQETQLTPANVRPRTFGKVFERTVIGQIYAQPLYVPNVDIPGIGLRNVVFVATQANYVYAFDADTDAAPFHGPLWTAYMGDPVPSEAVDCFDTVPTIGITSTPVIDQANNRMFLMPKTIEGGTQHWRIRALDIRTGAPIPGWGMSVQASIPGTNGDAVNGILPFQPVIQNQRTGLVLLNGRVYAGFSAHCGNNYHRIHGWVFSWNAANPAASPWVWNVTPDIPQSGVPRGAGGGIWMGGASPAVFNGNLVFVTSNGPFDRDLGGRNAGNSLIRFDQSSADPVMDHFTPSNQEWLQGNVDFGAGGPLVIPTQTNTTTPNTVLAQGKAGVMYLLNLANLGGFTGRTNQNAPNNSLQELFFPNGFWSSPAYMGSSANNFVYANAVGDLLRAFRLTRDGQNRLQLEAAGESSSVSTGYPSSTPVTSSNGTQNGTGIVWLLNRGSGALHAFDAENVQTELFNTNAIWERDGIPGVLKFTVPMVANGRVYVGSEGRLLVYGLNPPNRGVFDRYALNGPNRVPLNGRASFVIGSLDVDGNPAPVTRSANVDIVLPDGTARLVGTLLLRRQSSAVVAPLFNIAGNVRLVIDRGTLFEQSMDVTVYAPPTSGLASFAVSGPTRVEANQVFVAQVKPLDFLGRQISWTGSVRLWAVQSDGRVREAGTLRFSNQNSAQRSVRLPRMGSAILVAQTPWRVGSRSMEVLGDVFLNARAQLGNWEGATRPNVRIQLRSPSDGRVLESFTLPIQDDRTFSVNARAGVYDVSVKITHWLRQTKSRVYLPMVGPALFNGPLKVGLVNGDTNDDDRINNADVLNVQGDLGGAPSGTRGWTDLNGDGTVNQSDLDIVNNNLGQVGNP